MGTYVGIPTTKKGLLNMQREIDALQDQIPAIQKAVAEARAKGDLRENAEYHAAREQLGMTEAKIAEIQSRISQATIISSKNRPSDEIAFGARVLLLDIKYEDEEEYELVGMGEADPMQNKILPNSPMGRAMLNRKVGEEFVVEAPAGRLNYRVLSIDYPDDDHE